MINTIILFLNLKEPFSFMNSGSVPGILSNKIKVSVPVPEPVLL